MSEKIIDYIEVIITLLIILGIVMLLLMFVTYLIGGSELVNKLWGWTDFLSSSNPCEPGQELYSTDRWETSYECR